MKNSWTAVLCGVAGLVLAATAVAKDNFMRWIPAAPVDFTAMVSAVREVPAAHPMPGLHLDAKVKGVTMDIYIAPMDFVVKYAIKISKGDYLRIVGTQTKVGETDIVLARNITTGTYDRTTGMFRENMTVYLRDENGPFWVEVAKPASGPISSRQ
jgi:hypothetical protein